MANKIPKISQKEKNRLRELAKRQLELAFGLSMETIYKRQWSLNHSTGGTCPVVRIETEGFAHELVPSEILECETSFARDIERRLLFNIRHCELVGDDRLVPKTFPVEWMVNIDPYGFPLEKETGAAGLGVNIGYKIQHAIQLISEDFYKLKPLTASVDRESTEQYRQTIDGVIGDILPVEMIGWPKGVTFLTRNLLELMSMEDMYQALYDEPDQLHRIMEYLLSNAFALMEFYEKEEIMYINNGIVEMGNASCPLTDAIPGQGYTGKPRLIDMFLRTDSQETIGISPAMFDEFFFPYYRRLCEKAGLWYYGCCEPIHAIWENALSNIKNIKKVSISKWCDEETMGNHLSNKPIVYSRKLDALFLGKDSGLDTKGLAEYIKTTMRYAKGCQIEFLAREVYSLHGNLGKLRTAVEIIRGIIGSE